MPKPHTLITFEGTDGVGKTACIWGWDEQTLVRGQTVLNHRPGVLERLAAKHVPVVGTKEPGIPAFRPFHVEEAFNKAEFWITMAELAIADARSGLYDEDPTGVTASLLTTAAAVTNQLGELPGSFYRVLANPTQSFSWPEKHAEDFLAFFDRAEEYGALYHLEPTIRERVRTYGPRGCIRHALLHAADSTRLHPDASGLLFLANHVLHQGWIKRQKGKVVISDRYADSNIVFGAVRGDDPQVRKLYDVHARLRPRLKVLLACDSDELEERLENRGDEDKRKQLGKAWNTPEFRREAQAAYVRRALEEKGRWLVVDTTGKSLEEVASEVTQSITNRLFD